MAHQQQIDFCLSIRRKLPRFFVNKFVVDIGSLDINGSNQYLFENCLYIGVDLLPGKNVDLAVKGHELHLPSNSVDVIISTECFEHDQFYALTLKNIARMLKPGGLFLFSCATTGRPEHGTRRTTPHDAPFIQGLGDWEDYYQNLEEKDIRRALDIDSIFEEYAFSINFETCDLYFWGIKKGCFVERDDYSFQIKSHHRITKIAVHSNEDAIELGSENKELNQMLIERESQISYPRQVRGESEGEIARLSGAIKEQNREIYDLNKVLAEYSENIRNLNQALIERDKEVDRLNKKLIQRGDEVGSLNQKLLEREFQFNRVVSSRSWILTKPLRFAARLIRCEFYSALSPLRRKYSLRLQVFTRAVYHRLPLSTHLKLRLRERMQPLVRALRRRSRPMNLGRAVVEVVCGSAGAIASDRDYDRERALARILSELSLHATQFGPASHWIALPFLSTGGAEMVALNLCKALREIKPKHSVVLVVTDRRLVNEDVVLPSGVALIVFDNYLTGDLSYARKQSLLRDLLVATRPKCFHNINSEVAWHLILAEGELLKRAVSLYASIFAFQFLPNVTTKIGYAAYFLKKGMPHLSGLISDNKRFIHDASMEYEFDEDTRSRMHVLYQPCRLLYPDDHLPAAGSTKLVSNSRSDRPQVLWAGRLDAEKRVDLFLDVVRHCHFADFYIFGQIVLGDNVSLPTLPNLRYEGPFTSPLQWIEQHRFDAFLFTSKWEGMPNILIEVGALGIPVIAPTVGGVGELITETTGYPLPEQPSIEDYVVALKSIASIPDEAHARAQHLRELISIRHGWRSFVTSVKALPGYAECRSPVESCENIAVDRVMLLPYPAPVVSVIIPCYNQGHYLYECVASVLTACHDRLEIIVVDDGGTDPKIEYYLTEVVNLAPDVVRVHRQKNQGLSGARNSGVQLARGEFVQFVDADDILVPGKVDAQLSQLLVNPWLDVSICNFLLCDEARHSYSKPDEAIARFNFTLTDFLYHWERGFAIPIHCGLFRRRVLARLTFDAEARAKEDWLFWTTLAFNKVRFGYVHGHWAIYRQHDNSMRRSYVNMGRAWLHAAIKIDAMLEGQEPLFLESVVNWFDKCYRAHPRYQEEMAALQGMASRNFEAIPRKPVAVANEGDTHAISDGGASASSVDVERLVHRLSIISSALEPPLFTIVVPIYGHFVYLEACLESIAKQGNVSIEIICVDDASPDLRITSLMRSLENRVERLKVIILSKNCGISEAQNKAVEMATGEYVAFLDCDDELEPGALSVVRDYVVSRPDVDYFFTDRYEMDSENKLIRTARYGGYDNLHFRGQESIRMDLLDGMVASHLKVIRRSAYVAVGGCDRTFSGVQDWDLALKVAERGSLFYIAEPLYRHRLHRYSVTSRDRVAQFRKTNVVRRRFCERWLRNSFDVGREKNEKYFSKTEFPVELAALRNYWSQGYLCVADATGALTMGQINFLREFNSYFDRIEWDDPAVPASLVGYLHDNFIIDCSAGGIDEVINKDGTEEMSSPLTCSEVHPNRGAARV